MPLMRMSFVPLILAPGQGDEGERAADVAAVKPRMRSSKAAR